MRFLKVRLVGGAESVGFYRGLGFPVTGGRVYMGESVLEFTMSGGVGAYHLALLVSGNQFDQAFSWLKARIQTLTSVDGGDEIFEIEGWNARACYFEAPGGCLVELVAHRGLEDRSPVEVFDATRVVGISEVVLVGDRRILSSQLRALKVDTWSGRLDCADDLVFAGEKGRTFILSRPGRVMRPNRQPVTRHPIEVLFEHNGRLTQLAHA